MNNIRIVAWGGLAALSLLWLVSQSWTPMPSAFFAWRNVMVQYSGVIAMGAMSLAMILALRPSRPEGWLGGLDKMYRLHKWLGIGALVFSLAHWLWAKGPKWAVGWGWLERPQRGPRAPIDNVIEQFFSGLRGVAESVGEWAFYGAALLIVVALVKLVPYRWFHKTHRLLAVAYLVLVFHTVVLTSFGYWTQPLALALVPLLVGGTWAALVVLTGRVGRARQVGGSISALRYFPGVRVLAVDIQVGSDWPGHRAGQFAFAMSDAAEGAHPYTIASAWNPTEPKVAFVVKELGDHTRCLREKLKPGQRVRVEGPYGCFTFDDDCPLQIWIGGGIGITPFIARMQHLAALPPSERGARQVHLFHTTAEVDEDALAQLRADATAAGIVLHILIDSRDGRLDGAKIRAAVPDWKQASLWFCGPARFGQALRRDFIAGGLAGERFHQELFAMR